VSGVKEVTEQSSELVRGQHKGETMFKKIIRLKPWKKLKRAA
jgi:hypothetical protein